MVTEPTITDLILTHIKETITTTNPKETKSDYEEIDIKVPNLEINNSPNRIIIKIWQHQHPWIDTNTRYRIVSLQLNGPTLEITRQARIAEYNNKTGKNKYYFKTEQTQKLSIYEPNLLEQINTMISDARR